MATIKLYINTDRGDISRAFVKSTSEPTANALPPDLVAGNKRNIEVYLIDSSGNYDARSGASNYALSIGAGPLAGTPSSGTFTLTDGTSTTTALAFNAGAQAVEDALNALNSGAGPHSQLVDVTSTYNGNYRVKFRTTGAVANLAGDASELSPASAVVVDEAVAGDGSTKEQQYIRLLRQPAIFQDSFTQIANGWSGELSANNARVLELMAGRDTIAIPLDVELTETGNEPETIARGNMLLSNEVINPASIDPANLAQILTEAVGDARYLRTTNNLSDVTDPAQARANIGALSAANLNERELAGGVYFDKTGSAELPIGSANFGKNDFSIFFETINHINEFTGQGQNFFNSNGTTGNNRIYINAKLNGSLTIGFIDNTGAAQLFTFNNILTQNKDVSLLLTLDRNNLAKAFVDGINVGSVNINSTSQIDIGLGNNNPPVLNVSSNSAIKIKNFAIFNSVLTATQADELIKQGLQPWLAANPEYRKGNLGSDLPLAVSNNAAAAYGLEWLGNPNYTGPYVRVRRSSDNAEQDFSDKSLIAAWVGSGNDGFVTTWYEQSGNGNHATQSTASSQPKIVDNGVYLGLIKTDGVDDFFNLTTQIDFNSSHGVFAVYADAGGNRFNLIGSPAAAAGIGYSRIQAGDPLVGIIHNNGAQQNSNISGIDKTQQNTFYVLWQPDSASAIYGVSGSEATKIFTSDGANANFTNDVAIPITVIGKDDDAVGQLDLKEIIIYDTDQTANRVAIEANMAKRHNIPNVHKGAIAILPLNDDCRQLKDISGNRNDATASESGVTHLKQKYLHSFRDDHADATGGSYLIANADILAENEVITGVTVDGRFYAASGDQDLTKRRIKLQDHGSHVDVKRSNGTADDSAIAVTNANNGTDFAITVLTQRI